MTKKRTNEIQAAAERLVADYGIQALDAVPNPERRRVLREMQRELREQTRCHPSTAREHISRACRRLRYKTMQPQQDAPLTLTVPEAARRSGVPAVTLRAAIRRGEIEASKRGRDWLVDATSLERWLANRPRRGRPRGS